MQHIYDAWLAADLHNTIDPQTLRTYPEDDAKHLVQLPCDVVFQVWVRSASRDGVAWACRFEYA